MAKKERVIHFAMLFVGIVLIIESLRLGIGGVHRPGPGFLPILTGAGLSFAAFFSLIKNFLAAKREKDGNREELFGRSVLNVVVISIALVVYVLVFQWLGYLLSTFVLLIFLFKAGGFRRWVLVLAAAFLTISISYLLFGFWLNIRFPKGFLGF
jgi:putative tricarboxylic transport membrane protein